MQKSIKSDTIPKELYKNVMVIKLGKRIQDFRNLNLDSFEKKESKEIKSSLTSKEFIIEVEEKPRGGKTKNDDTKKKTSKKNNKKSKKKEIKKIKSPKTYIEEEAARKRKEKQKNTSIFVSTFILIFICIGIVAGCLTTPTFDIKFIEVDDGENVSAAEIKRYFSAVKGTNTFLANLDAIEENIESHPYIYKAEISRNLPYELKVNYIERKPYAIIKYIESYVFIDKYGSILEIKKENDMPSLPIIYGIETETFLPGQKLEGTASLKFENSVYLLETANHISFDYTISEINYTDSEEIKISINELNIEIIYGSITREILNDKMTYLNEVLKELSEKKGTLDISSNNYSEKVIFSEILK